MKNIEYTRNVLKAWGRWSNNETGCGWYSEMQGLKNVMPTETILDEKMSDADALVVDKMVACMYDPDNERPMVFFILHYVYGLNNCEIGRRAKCHEKTVRQSLVSMESFVSGMIIAQGCMGFQLEFGSQGVNYC